MNINQYLPFLLKRENVARYESGTVVICDRRKYPFEKTFVHCQDVEAVAQAIETMITQGGGPSVAAGYAFVGQARKNKGFSKAVIIQKMEEARKRLAVTRPTNTAMARMLSEGMEIVQKLSDQGEDLEEGLLDWVEKRRDHYEVTVGKMGLLGASLVEDGDGIMTMCFAETSFILTLAFAAEQGKRIKVYTPETRPYLQGARLTAPSVHELGIPVFVIGDNMPAHILSLGRVQKYFTAADLVTMDGHVVNKIGTYQIALAAHEHGVPYFALSLSPDPGKPDRSSIVIEERGSEEMRQCRGVPTTLSEIQAYYPAFDITPPHLVAAIITDKGILSPYALREFYGIKPNL